MPHFRLNASGHTPQGEIFTFTGHVTEAVVEAADILPTWVTAVTDLWGTGIGPSAGIAQWYEALTGIDEVMVDELDPVTGKNVRQARQGMSLVGESSDEPLPPQCAIVVSLRTALPTRAGRGRFYLPAPTVTTLVDGLLISSVTTAVANAAAAMIGDMNGAGAVYEVYHRTTKTGTPVLSVDVGNVVDTQRTRRDKLTEVRHSVTV